MFIDGDQVPAPKLFGKSAAVKSTFSVPSIPGLGRYSPFFHRKDVPPANTSTAKEASVSPVYSPVARTSTFATSVPTLEESASTNPTSVTDRTKLHASPSISARHLNASPACATTRHLSPTPWPAMAPHVTYTPSSSSTGERESGLSDALKGPPPSPKPRRYLRHRNRDTSATGVTILTSYTYVERPAYVPVTVSCAYRPVEVDPGARSKMGGSTSLLCVMSTTNVASFTPVKVPYEAIVRLAITN
mmetsp:Transcript_10721/g.35432  ORF Transcript_10721/g.35432 Transcript_10721/m.35432 type:complete len:246 (+) Transcript_10721:1217-1954(+)